MDSDSQARGGSGGRYVGVPNYRKQQQRWQWVMTTTTTAMVTV
jgi:hypothetical protein